MKTLLISLLISVAFILNGEESLAREHFIGPNVQAYRELLEDFGWGESDQLEKVAGEERESTAHEAWLLGAFLLQLVLLAYLKAASPKEIVDLKRGLMNLNIAQQMQREQELSMPLSAVIFNVNFVISLGAFVFLVSQHFGWMGNWEPWVLFLLMCWAVMIIFSIRFASLMFVSVLFPFKLVIDDYNFSFFLVQKATGIILIPLNLLLWLSDSTAGIAVWLALLIIVSGVAMTAFRGLSLGRSYLNNYGFHFLLYICTLEITPLVLLLKWAQQWVR